LGGKSPNIVFADADIPSAVAGALQGFTLNSGQACEAGTRVYVHEDIYDEFNAALVEAVNSLTIGPGTDPASDITPLVSEEQMNRVVGYLDQGKADGAKQSWAAIGGAIPATTSNPPSSPTPPRICRSSKKKSSARLPSPSRLQTKPK